MDSIFAPQSMTRKQHSIRRGKQQFMEFEGSFGKSVSKISAKRFEKVKSKPFDEQTPMGNGILDFHKVASGLSGVFDTPRVMTRQMSNSMVFKPEPVYMQQENGKKTSIKRTMSKKKSSNASQKKKPPKPSNDGKETRWKKENDRKLFPAFLKLVKEVGITANEFLQKETRMPPNKKKILEKLKEDFEWSGTIYALRDRIKKRLTTSKFTAREKRVLHRMLREHHDGKKTIEEVTSHFPGKTVEQVEKYKAEFFENVGLE